MSNLIRLCKRLVGGGDDHDTCAMAQALHVEHDGTLLDVKRRVELKLRELAFDKNE